ncbi:cellulose synthase/poly-beta-1,6-N-acetylglucosamine synthase-like glycosyltransferase [Arthrobacter sp. PvP023]|uniref:glycosyltransferase family 2 protein n=1 Tax=Micrococcaceae TaxID=1268 RepID=UPI001AE35F47|nr:glycosyltransferase [Arthrobacter sp. PvP023]MBP1137097.1 cellulose synthase/poly-beta-1,6-N-acetylglucosamine synthase-like glycosyltransferase [Arthrobacter sp. PvP023]
MIAVYIVLVLGVSTIFWSFVGLMRLVNEQYTRRVALGPPLSGRALGLLRRWPLANRIGSSVHGAHALPEPRSHRGQLHRAHGRHRAHGERIMPADVAVLVAAHNEALVISETIRAASVLVPLRNIHVISDMSSDDTAAIARRAGVKVLELEPNRGKAGALAEGISYFDLCRKFKVVMMLDADTRPTPDYLDTGLPLFSDASVVAVAGRAKSIMMPPAPTALGRFLVAYRERLYIVVQLLLKYGQAARGANVVSIVPGFASMYRTSALEQIRVLAPGLVIEDFNMTFEVHAKKLGRIAFHPSAAVAYTQDPDNLQDYTRQVRRWILGFWQTVRRHRMQAGKFWFVLVFYIFELVVSCIFFVLLIPVFMLSSVAAMQVREFGPNSDAFVFLAGLLRPQDLLLGVFLPDLVLTVIAATALRRPGILLMAPLFPLMRILDSIICLMVLPKAFSSASSGVWVSPIRRIQSEGLELEATAGAGASR